MTGMTTTEHILSSLLVAIIAYMVGVYNTSKSKVSICTCDERRQACVAVLHEKLTALEQKVDILLNNRANKSKWFEQSSEMEVRKQ